MLCRKTSLTPWTLFGILPFIAVRKGPPEKSQPVQGEGDIIAFRKRVLLAAAMLSAVVAADTIVHGTTTIEMEFVTIGYPGNTGDEANVVNGAHPGAVDRVYRIGKYEVTADQWAAVTAADASVGGTGAWSGSQPAGNVNWLEAARFCNWLTSGRSSDGAYRFTGSGALASIDRAAAQGRYAVVYVLPTESEWYKAAYFKADGSGYTLYATGDELPVAGTNANYRSAVNGGKPWAVGAGSVENNGTYDMNGNICEFIGSAYDGALDGMAEPMVIRGGSSRSQANILRSSSRTAVHRLIRGVTFGFRVTEVGSLAALVSIEPVDTSEVRISWEALLGANYRVQVSTDLVSSGWADLGGMVEGEGTTTNVSDSTVDCMRFYRVTAE